MKIKNLENKILIATFSAEFFEKSYYYKMKSKLSSVEGCCYSEEASYSADLLNDFLEVAQAEQENPEPIFRGIPFHQKIQLRSVSLVRPVRRKQSKSASVGDMAKHVTSSKASLTDLSAATNTKVERIEFARMLKFCVSVVHTAFG
ncbi:hypothetical protein T08_11515 [Trichinella sp. T8]|nr:hypothetical protein T08_11515 [Trichinella sp. T8]